MNIAQHAIPLANDATDVLLNALKHVSNSVAPSWPLDQMIAVNPCWQMRDNPIANVAAMLKTTSDIDLLLPCRHYIQLFRNGDISRQALEQALAQSVHFKNDAVDIFIAQSESVDEITKPTLTIAEQLVLHSSPLQLNICDEINSHISQFCAWYFQHHDSKPSGSTSGHLYQQYQIFTKQDPGISLLLDKKGLHKMYANLPTDIRTLIQTCEQDFALPSQAWPRYAQSLLRQLNGWASWIAYLNWQANLYGKPCAWHLDLIAIKLGWEYVLLQHLKSTDKTQYNHTKQQWKSALALVEQRLAVTQIHQARQLVWWRAQELEYQTDLRTKLSCAQTKFAKPHSARLQAVFCIDVRSEVLRRHLEQQDQHIETFGFAGFFGLPIEFNLKDSPLKRPQLPGLLPPVISVSPVDGTNALACGHKKGHWEQIHKHPTSSLPIVESAGWLSLIKLLKKSLMPKATKTTLSEASRAQQWSLEQDNQLLTTEQKADLAEKVLHLMGITQFAPEVLMVGHASHNENNLHAASLDCGACGGQSGEVNVRVLCYLLNDEHVRNALQQRGLNIPDTCQFIPALHNTTSDEVRFLDDVSEEVSLWFSQATTQAQQERAIREHEQSPESLTHWSKSLARRQVDWSQTRPEWGLANNAAFIIAPRALTKHIDFAGRTFLHSYDEALDEDGSTLELLLTAPMLVTNWINMQYNTSVTDPLKFGSGNKILHNAVGGHIGVFEGQGGDLRIGLPLQSVHNGKRWMHEPMRLTVIVHAKQSAIQSIINKHPDVKHLIENGWLYLWQWSDEGMHEWRDGSWKRLS